MHIKEIRKKIGTQKQVADKLGISERFLRARETDEVMPPAWLIFALKWLSRKGNEHETN